MNGPLSRIKVRKPSVNDPNNFSAESTDLTNFLEQLSPHSQTEYF